MSAAGRWPRRRRWLAGLVPLALGMLVVGVAGEASGVAARSPARPCKSPTAQPSNLRRGNNDLSGVAVMGCRAWAVGSFGFGAEFGKPYVTGVEYWNGRAWKLQKSPNPGGRGEDNILRGVAVTSSTNAWAVGWYGVLPYTLPRAIMLHWDGAAWKVQKSLNPADPTGFSELDGVAATSSTNAWAVGSYGNRAASRPLIEHWDGSAWKEQKSPNPGGGSGSLSSVAATSASNVWAVGSYGERARPLVEHWDGTSWKIQSSPRAAGSTLNYLDGVAATSRTNAWTVGYYYRPGGSSTRTLVLHWNGRAWKRQSSPNARRAFNDLNSVAATSRTNAWAVGSSPYYKGGERILLEHWNGTAWKLQPSPIRQGRISGLEAVAAHAPTNVWAVGRYTQRPGATRVLALHWNGTAWGPLGRAQSSTLLHQRVRTRGSELVAVRHGAAVVSIECPLPAGGHEPPQAVHARERCFGLCASRGSARYVPGLTRGR